MSKKESIQKYEDTIIMTSEEHDIMTEAEYVSEKDIIRAVAHCVLNAETYDEMVKFLRSYVGAINGSARTKRMKDDTASYSDVKDNSNEK